MDSYEKKYKEIVWQIKKAYLYAQTDSTKAVLENIFPELKESEDERMMHQLHSWMKEFGGAEEYTEKVYTWLKSLLEKQAQTFTKRDVDEAFVEGMAFAKNELEKQGEQKSQRMISAEVKEAMYDKPTDNDMVEALRTEYEKGKADAIAEMQKEWSEEDKAHINSIIDYLLDYKLFVYEEDMNVANGVQKELDWFKALQRIGG